MSQVILSASFDDLQSREMRLLEEAATRGDVHVLLWTDETVRAITGADPKFPQEERQYFVESVRFVDQVSLMDLPSGDELPGECAVQGSTWVVDELNASAAKEAFCGEHGLQYVVIPEQSLQELLPQAGGAEEAGASDRKKVLVTGCYDWLHTGHVCFFEEVAELGDLYVVVGHDANIKLLKGEGHPMHDEDVRRYMAGSIRFVKSALVSSGNGWLDAEPEIERIKPDMYAVNEDGDRAEKRDYCASHGIEYRVLKRVPKEGLPRRESTALRGF